MPQKKSSRHLLNPIHTPSSPHTVSPHRGHQETGWGDKVTKRFGQVLNAARAFRVEEVTVNVEVIEFIRNVFDFE